MYKRKHLVGLLLVVVVLLLAGCEGYTQMNSSSSEQHDAKGGKLTVAAGRANGTSTQTLETAASGEAILDATVVLELGQGSFKIELLGENDEVTMVLEAQGGQAVSGIGWMVTDAFGDASYRVTAVEAEDVEYRIEYVFR
jgi:ABC-type glycerol-3-phosphate transport system substrate-binding protein